MQLFRNMTISLSLILLALPALAGVQTHLHATALTFESEVPYSSAHLRLSGPGGVIHDFQSRGGLHFDLTGDLTDGLYTYELRLVPANGRTDRELAMPTTTFGYFRLQNGVIVTTQETAHPEAIASEEFSASPDKGASNDWVEGSFCVGCDCTNGESYPSGTSVLRMKDDVLRIEFDDRSTPAGTPKNDWQVAINEVDTGSASYFRIEDTTGSTVPWTIEAGAPDNSLYVADDGRIGFRTATPAADLHIADSSTPTVRLEQTGANAQIWDVEASNTRFVVQDATGNKTPFVLENGAPDSSIEVDQNGRIGLGTSVPASDLHIVRASNPGIRLEDSGDGDYWTMVISNSGLAFREGANAPANILFTYEGEFRVTNAGDATFHVDPNGDLRSRANTDALTTNKLFFDASEGDLSIEGDATIGTSTTGGDINYYGSLNSLSDVNSKQDLVPVDTASVLTRIAGLPLSEWSYKHHPGVRHMGPMAQDFSAAFGLGSSEKTISVTDLSAVSLAAIQELNSQLQQKTQEVEDLKQRMEQLEAALLALQQK